MLQMTDLKRILAGNYLKNYNFNSSGKKTKTMWGLKTTNNTNNTLCDEFQDELDGEADPENNIA